MIDRKATIADPTPRGRMSAKRRHHIFSENCTAHHVAPCCLCGQPIHRHNDQWIIEHKRALGLLGKDTNTNCAPAHVACATEKTHKHDLPMIRKAKRQGTPKQSSGRFRMPAGVVFSWKRRRYVRADVKDSPSTEGAPTHPYQLS